MKKDLIVCNCHHNSHHLILTHDVEDKMVYVSVKINRLRLWDRIKLLFGYQPEYEEIILTPDHKEQIINALNTITE